MRQFGHVIDGATRHAADGSWLDVFDPAIGQAFAQVASGTAADVDDAVKAAAAAFPAWSALPNSERARWLEKLADELEARLDDFAHAESRDGGKPIRLARDVEIPRAISNLRFFAHAATQFASESHHGQAGLNYTLRLPLGVVGTISPWNLPLYLFTWKIAPALAAGNTVVAKPSEVTPHTATMLGELAAEIGFPKGVLNIVHGAGPEVGEAIVAASCGQGGVLHRQHRGRQAHRRACGTDVEEGLARTGRQEPDARVRRQRLARTPRHDRALGLSEQRPDLPVRIADPGRAPHLQRLPRCLRRARARAASR